MDAKLIEKLLSGNLTPEQQERLEKLVDLALDEVERGIKSGGIEQRPRWCEIALKAAGTGAYGGTARSRKSVAKALLEGDFT